MHYMLAQLQKPQNRHYSALGPLYLKIKVSKIGIYEIFVKYGIWRRWRLSKYELYLQDEHCIQR